MLNMGQKSTEKEKSLEKYGVLKLKMCRNPVPVTNYDWF